MFQEVKDRLPVSGNGYDAQIIGEIKACVLDLTTSAEIELPGDVAISRDPDTGVVTDDSDLEDELIITTIAITRTQNQQGVWTITDTSTLTDELILTAISVWCNMRIGNPPNYDNLLKAYNSLKGQLRLSKRYTTGGADGCGC